MDQRMHNMLIQIYKAIFFLKLKNYIIKIIDI